MSNTNPLDEILPEKKQMVDGGNRPLTQSLFLEINYPDTAIYTLKDNDYIYNGKVYPSLKRLYLLIADPTEYQFATICLLGWKHWQRICENKVLRKHVDEWREELEIKLRSQAVIEVMQQARTGSFQASKWLADRGWVNRGAGRPTKDEVERERKIAANIKEEYSADIKRLADYQQ